MEREQSSHGDNIINSAAFSADLESITEERATLAQFAPPQAGSSAEANLPSSSKDRNLFKESSRRITTSIIHVYIVFIIFILYYISIEDPCIQSTLQRLSPEKDKDRLSRLDKPANLLRAKSSTYYIQYIQIYSIY